MKIVKKIPLTIISTLLVIVFPFVIFTFVTSKTPVIFNIHSFAVLTGSMQPLLPVGSMIYAQQRNTYNVNEIITFKDKADRNVTHRIVAKTKKDNSYVYTTRGDANNTNDATPVLHKDVVGKAFFYAPYLGKIVNELKTPQYFFDLIIIPSLIFIGMELWNIKKEIERSTERRVLKRLKEQQVQA